MKNDSYIKNPQLEGQDFFWQGNQTGLLLIHGFTATTAEVRLIAQKLHQAGFTTAGPLLPGHGSHPDDLNNASWPMWVESVKQSYEELLKKCEQVFVIGESMGALLALELAAQHPEIAGVLLFAPAIKVEKLWLARFLAPFKKYLEKSGKDDGLLWQGYNVYPIKAAVELLKLQNHTRSQLQKVAQPTIVFTGEHDRTISPKAAEIVLSGIRANPKCLVHMHQSSHCILLDQELDQVFDHIIAFINSPAVTGTKE